jgi:exopolysaccharide biosynthesis protein
MRKRRKRKQTFKNVFSFVVLILLLLGIYTSIHSNYRPIIGSTEDLGKRITIKLSNGATMKTYEKYIIQKNGKMYYKSNLHEMDITGAKIIKQ